MANTKFQMLNEEERYLKFQREKKVQDYLDDAYDRTKDEEAEQ